MRRNPNLSGLGDTLSGVLKQYHLDTRTKQQLAALHWAEVVGEKCAAASQPEAIRDGILFVACKSSAWAQELTFLKAKILHEMNKLAGAEVIKDIRFSGKGLPKPGQASQAEEVDQPSQKEIQAVELSKSELDKVSKAAESVRDPVLAQRMRAAMESAQKLEKWHLAHGWRKCSKCGDAFKAPGDACERCR
jgi:predicted nucleic acid-binding Zn ribbon protein